MPEFVPHYQRVIDDITRQINDGELSPGDPLPSTANLAKDYLVSPGTVRRAIELLIDRGTLRGHQGIAVYVAKINPKD